jgi:FlaA1/EpsC-like NDP-sugar epimerase
LDWGKGQERTTVPRLLSAPSFPEKMISEFYVGQTVLVTGTTGFVGKCLLEKLLRDTKVEF